MFTSGFLVRERGRAIRRGVWYRALDNVERGIITLACRVVDRVRSAALGVQIVKILSKLQRALKSEFTRHMETYGSVQARRNAGRAVEWGYGSAGAWARDMGFIKYLAFIDFNRPSGWGE